MLYKNRKLGIIFNHRLVSIYIHLEICCKQSTFSNICICVYIFIYTSKRRIRITKLFNFILLGYIYICFIIIKFFQYYITKFFRKKFICFRSNIKEKCAYHIKIIFSSYAICTCNI